MNVRRAAAEDFDAIAELWRQFDHELPPPTHEGPADVEQELGEVREIIASEIAFVAEDEGTPVGFALARRRAPGFGTLTDLYVAQDARRSGIATELMREVLAAFRTLGIEHLDLDVLASNNVARSLYARWGLKDEVVIMTGSIADLEAKLGSQEAASFGSIHIQSDDLSAVEQAVRQFVPRLPGGSRGSLVAPPRAGWIAVYDDVCDRNPEMLRRLARELCDRMGAVTLLLGVEREELVRMILFERGRIVDEYLSVPEFYGPLPPGDVVGLAANPTVVSRLTGAEPEAVRRVARTAPSPADLPPARELLAELAAVDAHRGLRDGLGRRTRARGIGEDRAPVKVVLLHGWPVSERVWVSQVSALRDAGFDPIAPHLYGRGPSIDDWAAQLLREIDGPLVPVGASMGGYCALALARRAPERIVGMALVGSRADADSFERRRLRQEQIVELRVAEVPDLADEDAESRASRRRAGGDARPARPHGCRSVVRRPAARMRRRPGRDRVRRRGAASSRTSALDGKLEVFPGAGHFVAVDQPEQFNAVLLDFLSQWKT